MSHSQDTGGVRGSIDVLFEIEAKERPEAIREFLDRLHTSHSEAHEAMLRRFKTLTAVWVIAYAVHEGIVSGGEIASFRLERFEALLLAAPFLLGVMGYSLFAALKMQNVLEGAIQRAYKHFLPTAYLLNLEPLLFTPSLWNIEKRFGERKLPDLSKRIGRLVWWIISLLSFFGPLLGILHTSYLSWSAHNLPSYLIIFSGFLGFIFWIRGSILLFTDYETFYDDFLKLRQSTGGEIKNQYTSANPAPAADV